MKVERCQGKCLEHATKNTFKQMTNFFMIDVYIFDVFFVYYLYFLLVSCVLIKCV